MLNQLIESKNHQEENARKNGFLLTTLGVLVAVLISGWTYSLFAKNFGMGTGDFELSSILAPVAVSEEPPPKPEMKPEKTQTAASNKIILKDLYADVETTQVPPKDLRGEKDVVSATKFNLSDVKLGNVNQIPETVGRTGATNGQGCGLCENGTENKPGKDDEEKVPEVVVKPSPKPTPKKDVIQSLGVINGKATYLAKPPYPAAAKAMNITGAVNVQVFIDEKGNVVSASIVSGHPLLRAGAENAARQSKFTPTYLSNQAVKVTGVIVYQFKP